jgi:hypothetical protein
MLGSLVVQRADMTARPDPKAGAERLRFIWEIRPYSLALVPFIAAVAAAGISQAGATGLSEEDRSAINRLLGEDVLGPALPADPVGEKTTLIPLAPSTRIFRFRADPTPGRRRPTSSGRVRKRVRMRPGSTRQAEEAFTISEARVTEASLYRANGILCSAHLSGTTHHSL